MVLWRLNYSKYGKRKLGLSNHAHSRSHIQALVIAGLADANRPAHKLSVRQSGALAATGIIWSRYSLVITPKNWNLFSVNIFVACTGLFQLARIWRSVEWQPKHWGSSKLGLGVRYKQVTEIMVKVHDPFPPRCWLLSTFMLLTWGNNRACA